MYTTKNAGTGSEVFATAIADVTDGSTERVANDPSSVKYVQTIEYYVDGVKVSVERDDYNEYFNV
jgi:hypothetical protein